MKKLSFYSLVLFVGVFLTVSGGAFPAQAAWTRLCNESSEDLYIATRYHKLLSMGRTEGWTKLPVRGFLRSCVSFNRTFKDNYFVLGVKRGKEIVPFEATLRKYDFTADGDACVPILHKEFSYRSGRFSDRYCDEGYRLAPISFGVAGGSNYPTINIGVETSQIRATYTPKPVDPAEVERLRKIDAEKRKKERQQREQAATKARLDAMKKYDTFNDQIKGFLAGWRETFDGEFYLCEDNFLRAGSSAHRVQESGVIRSEVIPEPYNIWSAQSWSRFYGLDLDFTLSSNKMSVHVLPKETPEGVNWPAFACITSSTLFGGSEKCYELVQHSAAQADQHAVVDMVGPYYFPANSRYFGGKGNAAGMLAASDLVVNKDVLNCGRQITQDLRREYKRSELNMLVVSGIGALLALTVFF